MFSLVAAGCAESKRKDIGLPSAARPAKKPARAVPALKLMPVARFERPINVTAVPETDVVLVAEQTGRVLAVEGLGCARVETCPSRLVEQGALVIDIRSRVSTGGEQGLLGLAIHPRWPSDDRIFLNYTARDGSTRVEEWHLGAPTAKASRKRELMRIAQPYENHNGGQLLFGPDGLLYIGTGDGGSSGDPEDRAQEDDELLGKILRINVDSKSERGYDIPTGNSSKGAAEVWALGLRNPWRFSFDAKTGDLWIGDVGQDSEEEVNAISNQQVNRNETMNFGWRRFEGFTVFDASGRKGAGIMVDPVLSYGRADGCSVTGGIVYRGKSIPLLRGWYVFADYCGQQLRLLDGRGVPGQSFKQGELKWTRSSPIAQAVSFAEIRDNELLVMSHDGTIYQVLAAP